MNILERIKERGYEVMKAGDYDEDNPYAFNYGHLVIRTPKGEVKSVVGRLDTPLYIGDKTLQTSRRELIIAIYNPDENALCLLDNGYDLKSKAAFDKAKVQLGLKDFKSEEEGNSLENESTKEFPTRFVNGNAELTYVNGDYAVQLFHQADIDCFITDTFVFDHEPTMEEFHAAYDLTQFEFLFKGKRIKEKDSYDTHWTERVATHRNELGNAYQLIADVCNNT